MANLQLPTWVQEMPSSQERDGWVQFYALPERLRDILFDVDVAATMWKITHDDHKLAPNTVNTVSSISGLVVQGKLSLKDFIPHLVEEAKLDEQTARAVAKDINEQIFQPVREDLMQVHGISENGEITQPSDNDQPSPTDDTTREEMKRSQPETPEGADTTQPPPTPPAVPLKGKDELLNHLNGTAKDTGAPKQKEGDGQKINDEAGHPREELLERLKKAEGADMPPTSAHPDNLPVEDEIPVPEKEKDKKTEEGNNETDEPKATVAAWNGKTIDLTKIPPRRQIKKKEEEEAAATVNEREIKLKKGPDGYWYEI